MPVNCSKILVNLGEKIGPINFVIIFENLLLSNIKSLFFDLFHAFVCLSVYMNLCPNKQIFLNLFM